MSRIKQRLIGHHEPNCGAVEQVRIGRWKTPWALARHVFRDARGLTRKGSNGTTSWIEFGCNHIGCPARLLLLEEDVLVAALGSKRGEP